MEIVTGLGKHGHVTHHWKAADLEKTKMVFVSLTCVGNS